MSYFFWCRKIRNWLKDFSKCTAASYQDFLFSTSRSLNFEQLGGPTQQVHGNNTAFSFPSKIDVLLSGGQSGEPG